jgi:drug/metabolite transporter (DMT)-like permease
MLLSSLSFAIVNFMVKLLTNDNGLFENIQEYEPYELVFYRSVISLTICSFIIFRKKIPFFGNNKKWLLIRGATGATALTMLFYTMKHLPLAVATIIQYLSPIFTIIFAIFLLKQKVKSIQWLYFAIAISGVAIIGFNKVDNTNIDIEPIWVCIGVISAVLSGIAYNAIMKCRTTDDPITVVMYFPLLAAPVTLTIMLVNGFTTPHGIEWLVILLIGLFTQIAQVCMTRSFHSEDAAKITPLKYIGAIYAVCIGLFIFDETLSQIISIGIALILTGVLLNTFFVKKRITQN